MHSASRQPHTPPPPPPTPPTASTNSKNSSTHPPPLTRRISNVEMLVQNEYGVAQEVEIDEDQEGPRAGFNRKKMRAERVIRRRNSELNADMIRTSAAQRRRQFTTLLDEHRMIVQRLEQMQAAAAAANAAAALEEATPFDENEENVRESAGEQINSDENNESGAVGDKYSPEGPGRQ